MKYFVTVLRTPTDGHPVVRAGVKLEAVDVVEAALRAVQTMETEMPGTTGDWWAVAAVPETEALWMERKPHKTGRCDANDG